MLCPCLSVTLPYTKSQAINQKLRPSNDGEEVSGPTVILTFIEPLRIDTRTNLLGDNSLCHVIWAVNTWQNVNTSIFQSTDVPISIHKHINVYKPSAKFNIVMNTKRHKAKIQLLRSIYFEENPYPAIEGIWANSK